MVLRQLLACLLVSLGSCLACTERPYTDQDPTTEVRDALVEWDESVGVLRPNLSYDIVAVPHDFPYNGYCRFSPAKSVHITIYRGTFHEDDFAREVRHTMLHELGHAHGLGHSSDPTDLMYPKLTEENVDANVNPSDAALIREAWIR